MSLSLKEMCRLYLEYSSENLSSMIEQILRAPNLISEINKISPKNMKFIRNRLKNVTNEILDAEVSYYIKKYNIKKARDFTSLFEKLSPNDLKKIRQKIVKKIILKKLER